MPNLDTSLHLDMLKAATGAGQPATDGLYGLHWGDPEKRPELMAIRDKWLLPYVHPGQSAVEIGPGGGRWTRYMLPFRKLYAVDYHEELLSELRKNFSQSNIIFVKNNGTDFPTIRRKSIDFIYSFGVFVHLDTDVIRDYLVNMRPILRKNGNAVIQYSDKDKAAAMANPGFSNNNPRIMRKLIEDTGYSLIEEDTRLLSHSSIVRFTCLA